MTPTYALTASEIIYLCVTSAMKFPAPVEKRGSNSPRPIPTGRTAGTKDRVAKGRVREVAIRLVDGGYPDMTFPDVGELEGVDGGSLRAAVWRVRQERASTKRRAVA